jgi:hypothetical protein
MDVTDDQIKKAIVAINIEKVLLEMGKPVFDTFTKKLYKNYNCYIPDCSDHPEYLNQILKEMYGSSYKTIVDKITDRLIEFSYQKSVAEFIKVISD